MLSRHWKFLSFPLLFLLLVFLGEFQTAQACSCGPQSTVLDAYDDAEVVVVARAVSVEKASQEQTAAPGRMSNGENYVDGVKSTAMRVEQVFKGGLKIGDDMIFAQGGGADCIWTFDDRDVGKKFLFYVTRFKGATAWIAVTCGRSRNVEYAANDLLYLNNLDKTRGRTRISGTLSFDYETDESVARRKIRIVGAKHSYELKTDENGVYEIYDVPAGKYWVEPELPRGWKIENFWLSYSPSFAGKEDEKFPKKIPIVVTAKKHAGLDIRFEIDNAVRGHIYDPSGTVMKGICLHLLPADGTDGKYLGDCTEDEGAFEIDEIPPGDYVIVVNKDGKVSSSEPFGTFYYPNATKREDATVFHIGLGDFVEDLKIYPTVTVETVTVEGMFLYSDGKPVVDEGVYFHPGDAGQNVRKDYDAGDARTMTDSKGRFSIKILKGAKGFLSGRMYSYVGQFENCPKLERIIRQGGGTFAELRTPSVEIVGETNLYEIVLRYPFPGCKKAKTEE